MLIYKSKNNKYRLEFDKSKYNTGYCLDFLVDGFPKQMINLSKDDVLKMLDFINKKEGVL